MPLGSVSAGKVYLVGAGPGDPELITLRGLRCLQEADLILYDALVHPQMLEHCRPDAEQRFVGKRAGEPSIRQERINTTLVEEARRGRILARLKGGDPYLFGRGSEEAEILAAANIPFEVVPGIPSPLAATAYAGISLTHRRLASSVAYLTATESSERDRSAHDWSKLATATQSLVIFMGRRNLRSLMQLLRDHGRPLDCPVAVIQSASLPSQRTVVGSLADIADRVEVAQIGMPALTVVGPVVSLRQSLRWFDCKPLFGKRVLVTRTAAQAKGLSRALRDEGADPLAIPLLQLGDPPDDKPLSQALNRLDQYDWVLFTSRNAVQRFFAALDATEQDTRALGRARLAAIGRETTRALGDRGLRPDLLATNSRGEGLAEAVIAHPEFCSGQRVLLPRALVAREILPETLRRAGGQVDVVPVYRTRGPSREDTRRLVELFAARPPDAVVLMSPSAVEQLCNALGEAASGLLAACCLAAVGPVTADALRAQGLKATVVAEEPSSWAVVKTLVKHYGATNRGSEDNEP